MSYPSDYYATLVQAGTAATGILTLPNQVVESVYTDYDSGLAQFGQTVNVVIPTVSVSNASDITNSGITGVAPGDSEVAVTLNHKYSSNRKIPSFEAVSANPIKLAQLYIAPVIEEVVQKLNTTLAATITTTNFPTGAVTGGADVLTRANISSAWAQLRTVGVPMGDGNLNLLVHPVVYGNMMSSSEFANESVVGVSQAEAANQRAVILPQYGATLRDDPHMPVTSGAYTCILMHKYAIALRTAVEAQPTGTAMIQTTVFPKPDLPVQLQLWFEPKDQAWYIHAYILCGFSVARATHGCVLTTS